RQGSRRLISNTRRRRSKADEAVLKGGLMSTEPELNRREFLKASANSTASLAALSGITFLTRPERVFGANDRVRVAVCGLHGRGMDHVHNYSQLPNVEIAAVCDVDENVLRERLATMDKKGIRRPKTYIDVRKLLDDKSVD